MKKCSYKTTLQYLYFHYYIHQSDLGIHITYPSFHENIYTIESLVMLNSYEM